MILENNHYNIVGLKLTEFCGKSIKGKDFIGFRSSGHIFTTGPTCGWTRENDGSSIASPNLRFAV